MTNNELTRRRFIYGAGAAAGSYALLPLYSTKPFGDVHPSPSFPAPADSLKDHAARCGLLYGSSVQQRQLASDQPFRAAFISQCSIVVPELELKWAYLRPGPQTYNFSGADYLCEFAQANQMKFRGHTLVWHDALPSWFAGYVNSGNAQTVLLDHISTVMARYAGKVHSWDVVNEAISPADKRSDGLRNTPWLRYLGPGYIETAFRAAAQADPDALLVWNENSIEEESAKAESKRGFFLQQLKYLRSRGVPIQGVGLESHINGNHTNIAGPGFKQFLGQVSDLGLKILVTEMDVGDQDLPYDIGARDQAVADRYFQYLECVLAQQNVLAVLTWGLSNKYTWLPYSFPRPDKAPMRPLPLDANMKPTPAWSAIARAFDDAPSR